MELRFERKKLARFEKKSLILRPETIFQIVKPMKILKFLLFWLLCGNLLYAQNFEKPELFAEDVSKLMDKVRTESIGEITSGIGTTFPALKPEHQKLFLNICREMLKKKHRNSPHFEDFFASVYYGRQGKLTDEKLEQFLNVTDTVVREMHPKVAAIYFSRTRLFLKDANLFVYRDKNQVQISGGNFSFGFGREAKVEVPAIDETAELPPLEVAADTSVKTESDGWDTATETGEPDYSKLDWGDIDETPVNDDWGTEGDWGGEGGDPKKTGGKKTATGGSKIGTDPGDLPPLWLNSVYIPDEEITEDKELIAGPYIKLDSVNIMIRSPYDTVYIKQTSGHFLTLKDIYAGQNGRFDFSCVGLPTYDVYCDFSRFSFMVRKAWFVAKSAKLAYKSKVDSLIIGKFEYLSTPSNNSANPTYPRFKSYYNDIKVKNIVEYAEYQGGFSLTGNRISSSSFNRGPAFLTIRGDDGRERIRAFARDKFVFGKTTVSSEEAKVTIFFPTKLPDGRYDSLMHPAMKFKFDANADVNGKRAKLLKARKNKKDKKYAPFFDTYHRIQIDADFIEYDIAQDTFNLSIVLGRSVTPAIIESDARFDEARMDKIQGILSFHPLMMAVRYGTSIRKPASLTFSVEEMASANKIDLVMAKNAMRSLAQAGYIDYYESQGQGVITILRKGVLYARAMTKQVDYDDIVIPSLMPGMKNMTFYLDSMKLRVRGVESAVLARIKVHEDTILPLRIYPDKQELIINKNRDINFNGMILAKEFLFKGSNFNFNYDTFNISMPKIDELKFVITDKQIKEQGIDSTTIDKVPAPVNVQVLKNSLKDVSGTLYINRPNNKSGNKVSSQYPIFQADKGGMVSFEGNEILNGAYADSTAKKGEKPKIYFDVDQFKLDSIARRRPSDLAFAGDFKSSGMLPVIRDSIQIMKDGSLGFEHRVNKMDKERYNNGYDLYNGKGKITDGMIVVDNKGIRATAVPIKDEKDGTVHLENKHLAKVNYLNAEIASNDFIMYADSMTSLTPFTDKESIRRGYNKPDAFNEGKIKAGKMNSSSVPDVKMKDYKLRWLVNQDSMLFTTQKDAFLLYDKPNYTFNGTMNLTPNALLGRGTFENDDAFIKSSFLSFREDDFSGNKAQFEIKSSNPKKPSVKAKNVKFVYDVKNQKANIQSEVTNEDSFEFPYSQYTTSLSDASWDIAGKVVRFKIAEGADPTTQHFTSTREDQAGLSYIAAAANYDVEKSIIDIEGVPFILVLDTEIRPKDGKVRVLKDAVMEKLKDAELTISQISQYYELDKGSIQIQSKNSYSGEATHHYKNDVDQTFELLFSNYASEILANTPMSDSLRNLPATNRMLKEYQRATTAEADVEEKDNFIVTDGKQFKGLVTMSSWKPKLDFDGFVRFVLDGPDAPWIKLKKNPDGSTSTDVYVTPKGINDDADQQIGFFFSKDERVFYSLTGGKKRKGGDVTTFMPIGVIKPNSALKKNVIISPQELAKLSYNGNRFEYSTSFNYVEMEGKFDLMSSESKFNITTSGLGKAKLDGTNFEIDMMLGFYFDEKNSSSSFDQMGNRLEDYIRDNRGRLELKRCVKRTDIIFNKIAEFLEDKDVKAFDRRFEPSRTPLANFMDKYALVLSEVKMKYDNSKKAFYSTGEIGVSNIYKRDIDAFVKGYVEMPMKDNNETLYIYLEFAPDQWYYFARKGKDFIVDSSSENFMNAVKDPKSKDKFEVAAPGEKDGFINRFKSTYGAE